MRLAIVSQEYPPQTAKGGIGTQAFAKAHGLAALGHEVHVISRSPQGGREEYKDGEVFVTRIGELCHRLPIHNWAVDCLTYSAEVAAEIAALDARSALDVVEFPEWASEGYIHLLNRPEINRLPTVVQLHGPLAMFTHETGWPAVDSELYRAGTAMEGACLRMADGVYSSSAYSAQWCRRFYGLDREIPVLHTGVDTRQFAPQSEPKEQRPTVLFAGRISRNKGVDVLMEACCLLARDVPGLQLRLLGRDKDQLVDGFRARCAEMGFPQLLDWPGFVPREELPRQFHRAHVFAAPSRFEAGPGLVNLEAMACGLPIVVASGSGAGEVVCNGKTGLLVPPGDANSLASALGRLLTDAALRQTMGAAARRYAVEHADTTQCLRRIEAFLLAHARRSSP
jgi:glycosyltransferase involved in cell wall biosynthesis